LPVPQHPQHAAIKKSKSSLSRSRSLSCLRSLPSASLAEATSVSCQLVSSKCVHCSLAHWIVASLDVASLRKSNPHIGGTRATAVQHRRPRRPSTRRATRRRRARSTQGSGSGGQRKHLKADLWPSRLPRRHPGGGTAAHAAQRRVELATPRTIMGLHLPPGDACGALTGTASLTAACALGCTHAGVIDGAGLPHHLPRIQSARRTDQYRREGVYI